MVVPSRRADDDRVLYRVVSVFFVACAVAAPSSAANQKTYSERVTRICAGARLFDGEHAIGTRAGAIAVSRDIRRTGLRRLRRVAAEREPAAQAATIGRWLRLERKLVAAYARDYLLIWYAIEAADTPAEHALLPAKVHALVHATDSMERQAVAYELRLRVPDCTGGGAAPGRSWSAGGGR
jgi:hypothetical protein